MKALKKLILGIALMTVTQFATAGGGDGLYLAVDMGRSYFSNSCHNLPTNFTSCKDHDLSHRVTLGKLIASYTTAEIAYYSSGQTIKKDSDNIADTINSVEWQLSGLRYIPIGDGRLLAYGRFGIVHWEASEAQAAVRLDTSGNSVLLGIGVKYYLTPDTQIRLQFDTHKVGNPTMSWRGDINFLNIGLQYDL